MAKKKDKWKLFEVLVHKIQSDLSPGAIVTHNVKIQGHVSKGRRQVDVLVEQNIGPQHIRVIVECKDNAKNKPVDLPEIEAFSKKLEDVRGQRRHGFRKRLHKHRENYGKRIRY